MGVRMYNEIVVFWETLQNQILFQANQSDKDKTYWFYDFLT